VADKQAYETMMIKQIVTDFQKIPGIGNDAEAQAAVSVLNDRLMRRWTELEAKVRERLVPVKHSITIAPLAG
jgi:recombinational DNA repair protein RecR